MGRKAKDLEPRWLIGLLNAWAIRATFDQNRGLGYSSVCPTFKSGLPHRARSYEPTGYSDVDHSEIQAAVDSLDLMRKLAVMRYFRIAKRASIDAEYPRHHDTWMYHLEQALRVLAVELNKKREDPLTSSKSSVYSA
jgi:hypothetical protein